MRFYYTISQVHVSFLQEGIKAHGKTTRVIICHLVAVLNGPYDMDVSVSLVRNK